ncbi:hypothetical protein GCM10010909_21880 [Acidocella aquatica]|uniref:Uncharacterized protein n=1 Tax=Acidocella aquatica TaxID=1922313 RepID=A0ABQ6AA67_9PROT|nr:hypothetical protein [Acidocella aquatica]GLR67507.1 hypothetical protein GCM10010909_21880 [Acidocella aquatica]
MSDAIFIVGYYRSGTSALSGALQRLGVKFFNEADPNEHNPLGFYEIPELIEFDVDLFNRLGVEWTDVRGLPQGWEDRADLAPFLSRLDEILRRRFPPGDKIWGLKHPHLCRTLPLYERAVRQAGHRPHVIHIFRDPWTAAASQGHKNGLSRAHALLLWLSYVTDGERQARHLPRSWLNYQDLLSKPADQLRRIEQDIGLPLTSLAANGLREAAGHLTGQLNRSSPLAHDGLFHPLDMLATRVWEAVQARDASPALWDAFTAETRGIVEFLTEIGGSRGRVIPAFGASFDPVSATPVNAATAAGLRAPERLDEGGRARLEALRAVSPALPRLCVLIIAPQGRAPGVSDTLESLRQQWHAPAHISILSADPVEIPGIPASLLPPVPADASRLLCDALNEAAASADYVAIINAGDLVSPDACLRFALTAAASQADMIYCDEIVPREGGPWVRQKPAWDITRLRQAAYVGDWVWYAAKTLLRLGGFDATRAGAEEYDFQLRLAEAAAKVERLPEALFTRCPQSRRDSIPANEFCANAAQAITAHLTRAGLPALVQNRQHLGLFHHVRLAPDPGTTFIMLCGGGEVAQLDLWLTGLLSTGELSGPIILAGADLNPQMTTYLTAVSEQTAALEGKVLAVPPAPALQPAQALAQALALVATPLTAIIDIRGQPQVPHWAEGLRARLADPCVVLAGARTLVPFGPAARQFTVQGPIVPGADSRLGAGHTPEDPGPGGWLTVDQEASALAPPALMGRTAALAALSFPPLTGDALWIDLCAQLRGHGARIVWTPDISFAAPAEAVQADAGNKFREGSPAARALPWADPYHHPALSLHGDLLATEQRLGLVRSYPADPSSVLITGAGPEGEAVLNAARALRRIGVLEADWAQELPNAADLGRRAPAIWARINPQQLPHPHSPAYSAVFTTAPAAEAKPVIAAAAQLFATSPGLVQRVRKLAHPRQPVTLWRPTLSAPIWDSLKIGTGLNTKPRVLWIDEGIAPAWFTDLINETLESLAWIVVEREGAKYGGSVSRIAPQTSEYAWAQALAELAPQILIRPADRETDADHYRILLAAAAGCHLLVDERLDIPPSLGAAGLPNRFAAWQRALKHAVTDLNGTLTRGQAARAAALALPSTESAPPPWAETSRPAFASAAE